MSLVEQVIEQLVNGADPRAMSPLQQDSMVDTARSSQQNGGISAVCIFTIWALRQENLSSGFFKKRSSNQSPQLHRLSRNLKFRL